MAMKNPPHPGEIVRHEVIAPLGLSVTEAAGVLGIGRPALSVLLNGRSGLSPDMAIRIEKAFGPKMEHLMRMQCAFDVARARSKAGHIRVRRYEPANGVKRSPASGIRRQMTGLSEG